jgi:hypothetical protein
VRFEYLTANMGSSSDEDGSAEEQFSQGEVGHYDPKALLNDGVMKRVKERYQPVLGFQAPMVPLGTDKPAQVNHWTSPQNTETYCWPCL